MYSVSDAYKLAVADSHRKSKMRAVLTTENTVINLDDNDIIKDSVYVTNQCTNGNEYEYGCVYAGECGITIKSAIDRYALYDAELKLYWNLLVGDVWEEIPLGVFYISEPNRINDKISIKALDGMTKLDVNVDEDTIGTMPQLITYIAKKCGIELAQTAEELSTYTNADYQLSLYAENIDTYRDALAYICMLTCCFATFDRHGKLKLVKYATEPCVELGKKQRFTNASFSDYTTLFSGVKARFIADENYAPYEAGEEGNGLVLDMGDIPVLRGLPETKHAVLDNVYAVLKNVSYTPCEIETLGNPAIDLGDYISNVSVGKAGKSYISPVTYYYWTYRGKHKLRAVGGNPKLSGVNNKQGKQILSLEGEIDAKSLNIKSYSNADKITFSSAETEIATLNYVATESSKIMFLMTVRLSVSLDGVLAIKFYNDAALDEDRIFRKYLERGDHYVTISELYTANTNDRHTISIRACMEYFESDTRKQQAEIQTSNNFLEALKATGATVADNVVAFPSYEVGVIDTTIATATIDKGNVKAMMYGQGVAAEGKWDGTINFAENINRTVEFKGKLSFDTDNFSENITANTQTPIGSMFTENIITVSFGGAFGFNIDNMVAYPNVGDVIKDYVFETAKAEYYTYDEYITIANTMFSLKTIYNYYSNSEPIDSGNMCAVAIDYTGLDVESVVISNG